MTTSALHILSKYWGYTAFRPGQEAIVQSLLAGKDTLALLPTGGGKSICFQIPAMMQPGICIVVSPLIALIKDQTAQLKRRNIPALSIYSGMSFGEVKRTLDNAAYGNFKFLYVSPERLETPLFLEYLPALPINFIAIDEAHCISQWGYDFRPPYLRIAALREHLPDTPVIALTASATPEVQQDICDKLQFKPGYDIFRQSFSRPALSYSVFETADKQNKLLEILNNVRGSAIVYCKTRKQTQTIAAWLEARGLAADFYHAGLPNDSRNQKQEAWVDNRIRVMACTNAFGMGIDKPDVRVVVHYQAPESIEYYYQEAGRAGRDGKRAYAVLLYTDAELEALGEQAHTRYPDPAIIQQVYKALMNHLQVPAGTGEGNTYSFDLAQFARLFALDLLQATYAIKALEQEGLLTVNDLFFKPATLEFTTTKSALLAFETAFPQYDPLIKTLLRSYDGIFDFPAAIQEAQLAQTLRTELSVVRRSLEELHHHGIVAYTPQKDGPQLLLLTDRMHSADFHFGNTAYYARKAAYARRVAALQTFITTTTACRNNMIDHYFGSTPGAPCGICDNCINANTPAPDTNAFGQYQTRLLHLLADGPQPLEQLLLGMDAAAKQQCLEVLRFLMAEEKIYANASGMLVKGKRG
jgi:ATP-dependent DNA helicase RecQ